MSNAQTQLLPPYSPDMLLRVLRANPDTVSFENLMKIFGFKGEADQAILLTDLTRLKNQGDITGKSNKFFAASKPLSDMAIARVQTVHNGERVVLHIEGVDSLPLPVTISPKQVGQHRLRNGDRILVKLSRHHGTELKAKCVMKLMKHKLPLLTGRFNKAADGSTVFVPNDKTIRTVFAAQGNVPAQISSDEIYVGSIPGRIDMEAPIINIIEHRREPETGGKIAHIIAQAHNLQIRHQDDAHRSARKLLDKHQDDAERRIFSREVFRAVDPVNSPGDADDAVFAEFVDGGMIRTVTIVTDVASYIHPHTRLDKYALERGRSYYFPQEREFFHMFPELLSVGLLALRHNRAHRVLYSEQFWDMDTGQLVNTFTGLGLAQNVINHTYGNFQNMLNEDGDESRPFTQFGSIREIRDREERIQIGNAQDRAYGNHFQREDYQAKNIVETLMLRSNMAFANALEDAGQLYLRRNHTGHFNDMAYDMAAEQLRIWGFELPYNAQDLTVSHINNIIGEAYAMGVGAKVDNYVRTKFLYRAQYSVNPVGHYGTGAESYGHFTSPIRRYADLFNQRSFHSAFGHAAYGLPDDMDDIEYARKVAMHLNGVDSKAMAVERDSTRYYGIRDLVPQIGNKMIAVLNDITEKNEVEILLPSLGLRKHIPAHMLPEDWRVAPNQNGLTFQGKAFLPNGSHLRVKIRSVEPHRAQWDFDTLEPRSLPKPKATAPLRAAGGRDISLQA